MRVTLKGFVKNTENSYGVFLNTITVETPNKERIILDRDTTEYDVDDEYELIIEKSSICFFD